MAGRKRDGIKTPIVSNGAEEYLVESILDKKTDDTDGQVKYLVKWLGWSSSANTWEPITNLGGCKSLLKAFEQAYIVQNTPNRSGNRASHSRKRKNNRERVALEPEPEEQPQLDPVAIQRFMEENIGDSDDPDSNYDSDEADDVSKDNTRKFLEFDVLEECPQNKDAEKMLGVISLEGILTYLVEWKRTEESPTPERSLIKSQPFALKFPSIVISFYEKHVGFIKKPAAAGEEAQDDESAAMGTACEASRAVTSANSNKRLDDPRQVDMSSMAAAMSKEILAQGYKDLDEVDAGDLTSEEEGNGDEDSSSANEYELDENGIGAGAAAGSAELL